MNYLGLDYGQKHIGVALATGSLAEPLTTLPTKTALQLIKELVNKYSIDELIIGQPDVSLKLEFEKFLNSLKIACPERSRRVNFKFQIVDETLSSHDARHSLLHTTQKKRRLSEHSASAAVILQNWLDSNLSLSVPLS
ncbi:MAG: hypothetical protein G01um101416_412 [Microgenomates group bacterium Gr01-1014_16]|nr:MAG: hypothetical protein G01um101416_412 [Microgenomates group bacterium Gr01-1014_16]